MVLICSSTKTKLIFGAGIALLTLAVFFLAYPSTTHSALTSFSETYRSGSTRPGNPVQGGHSSPPAPSLTSKPAYIPRPAIYGAAVALALLLLGLAIFLAIYFTRKGDAVGVLTDKVEPVVAPRDPPFYRSRAYVLMGIPVVALGFALPVSLVVLWILNRPSQAGVKLVWPHSLPALMQAVKTHVSELAVHDIDLTLTPSKNFLDVPGKPKVVVDAAKTVLKNTLINMLNWAQADASPLFLILTSPVSNLSEVIGESDVVFRPLSEDLATVIKDSKHQQEILQALDELDKYVLQVIKNVASFLAKKPEVAPEHSK